MSCLALSLLAVDPRGLAGAVLRERAGAEREQRLEQLAALLPPGTPRRRVPASITPDRLHGGLDLTATLAGGRPAYSPGILEESAGALLVLPSSERAPPALVAGLLELLDSDAPAILLALDEADPDEPDTPSALSERVAFTLSPGSGDVDDWPSPRAIEGARRRLPDVSVAPGQLEALCATSLALGVGSSRADVFALRAACAHAALAGRNQLCQQDLEVAATLVLAPRATRFPVPPAEQPPAPPRESAPEQAAASESGDGELPDRLIAAVRAVLPPRLLETAPPSSPGRSSGRTRAEGMSRQHGRRIGTMTGDPRTGARLDLVETLRAAAPWQRLRSRTPGRLAVRKADFRLQRRRQRTGTTIIFVVDASGSSALHRLAEAKGAVELLLAESYVRRDRVALIGFRGTTAELMLQPTRSLARARRALAGLPGGGGTPLATALVETHRLATQVARERDGGSTLAVLLTDARANVALDGSGGRPRAEADAVATARCLRAIGLASLLIDTSPRPSAFAATLAREMGAGCVFLPLADARAVSAAVRRSLTPTG